MTMRDVLAIALRSLSGNRLRTALTALGTVIGVASVITVLAIGEGASAEVAGQLRALGTNLLTVRPGAGGIGPVRTGSVETLTAADAAALADLPGVTGTAPEIRASAQLRHGALNTSAQVVGVTANYFTLRSIEVASGLAIDALDNAQRRRVVVVGANIADELFGPRNPVGARIQIRGIRFRAIGVLARQGDSGFQSPDDMVLVPITAHQGVLFGQEHLSAVSVQTRDESNMVALQGQIEELLRARHRLTRDQDDDFSVRSQAEMLRTMSAVTGTLTILLGAIALVSLFVGGIGIMNIMLASVHERTREIGVRMAVGARRHDILLQFLAEAGVVSLAGGLVGLGVGALVTAAIAHFGGWSVVIPTYAILLSLGVSLTIGVGFGVGPARRAARLDPIEALRQQ